MPPWILVTLFFPVLSFAATVPNYLKEVQPILNKRCVACHGCHEAPCQLNLQSYDGLRRGYTAVPIYSGKRVPKVAPTRLSDAQSVREWRAREFSAVITSDDEPSRADETKELKKSMLYLLLEQGQRNDAAAGFSLADAKALQDAYDKDERKCLATENQLWEHNARKSPYQSRLLSFDEYAKEYPQGGMPFGLPRLTPEEQDVMTRWMEAGAPGPSAEEKAALEAPKDVQVVQQWEAFFNGDSAQAQQSARYIYEHVFSAVITIDGLPGEYYELVRSYTREGAIDPIVTELPYLAPAKEGARVYYRLKRSVLTPVAKTQNIWHLDREKLEHLTAEFLTSDWRQKAIPFPEYGSNNQFRYFSSIPAAIRSRFMMENSRVIVGAMVQGTVCIGSRATYAIADHFWTWFLKPEVDPSVTNPDLGLDSLDELGTAPQPIREELIRILRALDFTNKKLVARAIRRARRVSGLIHFREESDERDEKIAEFIAQLKEQDIPLDQIAEALHHFFRSVKANKHYQEKFESHLRKNLQAMVASGYRTRPGLSILDLWTGIDEKTKKVNPNAWLNITRHEKSATVQFGPEGGTPQSIWVMSYSNFERLYYNLVAQFQVWGSLPHKIATWRHMSYVRLEGEDLAISLLPVGQREEVRRWFTHGLGGLANDRFFPLQSIQPPARPDSDTWIDAENASDTVDGFIQELGIRYNKVAKASVAGTPPTPEQVAYEDKLADLENRAEISIRNPKKRHAEWVFPQYLPNISYVRIHGPDNQEWVYTILANRAYASHTIVILENPEREPKRDTISFYRGFVGAYPNLFLEVFDHERFLVDIAGIRNARDWEKFRSKYAVERNHSRIWEMFDWFQGWKSAPHPGVNPVEQGVSDMSQYLF